MKMNWNVDMELGEKMMGLDAERIVERQALWNMASDLVAPVIAEHGLESYNLGPAPIFSTPPNKMTKVDQHIGHIQAVAEWLGEME